ncbi:MAG TPA: hypothetical protein VGK56_07765 [Anaerolineales bacterium]
MTSSTFQQAVDGLEGIHMWARLNSFTDPCSWAVEPDKLDLLAAGSVRAGLYRAEVLHRAEGLDQVEVLHPSAGLDQAEVLHRSDGLGRVEVLHRSGARPD